MASRRVGCGCNAGTTQTVDALVTIAPVGGRQFVACVQVSSDPFTRTSTMPSGACALLGRRWTLDQTTGSEDHSQTDDSENRSRGRRSCLERTVHNRLQPISRKANGLSKIAKIICSDNALGPSRRLPPGRFAAVWTPYPTFKLSSRPPETGQSSACGRRFKRWSQARCGRPSA